MDDIKYHVRRARDRAAREELDEKNSVLKGDNARLRALIKKAEWSGAAAVDEPSCPWCGMRNSADQSSKSGFHRTDCPAFTHDGEVR